jgi:hypothetical protein
MNGEKVRVKMISYGVKKNREDNQIKKSSKYKISKLEPGQVSITFLQGTNL